MRLQDHFKVSTGSRCWRKYQRAANLGVQQCYSHKTSLGWNIAVNVHFNCFVSAYGFCVPNAMHSCMCTKSPLLTIAEDLALRGQYIDHGFLLAISTCTVTATSQAGQRTTRQCRLVISVHLPGWIGDEKGSTCRLHFQPSSTVLQVELSWSSGDQERLVQAHR